MIEGGRPKQPRGPSIPARGRYPLAEIKQSPTHDPPIVDALAMHHWMALDALKAENVPEAEHHVRHIIELAEDPEHKQRMEQVLQQIQDGDLHEAEHAIEEMLVGVAEPQLSIEQLHLRLAYEAIEIRNVADAEHQMNHFVEAADGEDRRKGQDVLRLLQEEDLHDASHAVEELIGIEPHEGD